MDSMTKLVEVLRGWDDGLLNRLSLYGMLDDLLSPETIDQVIAGIPPTLRKKYVEHLQNTYGGPDFNGKDLVLLFGGAEDRERLDEHRIWKENEERRIVEITAPAVREWLAKKSGSQM
ncbi:hypothetical protein [Myxococcus virescens]|nr:hypothetical protein [Myxococcus virescens]SDF37397.1 hypothetical protein SAMN04488504_1395 [Myxococcus virescens]